VLIFEATGNPFDDIAPQVKIDASIEPPMPSNREIAGAVK
jgi:hypothetical protein